MNIQSPVLFLINKTKIKLQFFKVKQIVKTLKVKGLFNYSLNENRKLIFIVSLSLFLFFTCSQPEEEKAPPKNPHLETFTKEYVQKFDRLLEETNTPGAGLVIIKDSTVLHIAGHGFKSATSKDSVDIHTVFRIGSLSKGFAAVLAGILVQKGQLHWTDKVRKHIPNFLLKDSLQSRRINLVHVLSQSTGLPYHAYTNLIEAGVDIQTIAKEFRKVNLISKEGEIYAYQNAAYSLIGLIIEKSVQQPLPKIFEKELFKPLDAQNASTDYESIINAGNIAQPHNGGGGYWNKGDISKKYYNAIPAGGINASISDMAKWLELLLGNRQDIIDEKHLKEIFKPRINTNNRNRYFHDWAMVEDAYYGLGWRILTNPRDTFIYHGGFVNGYRGEILIHPKEKLGVCVLVNAPSKLANQAIPKFLEAYENRKDSIKAWEQRNLIEQNIKK